MLKINLKNLRIRLAFILAGLILIAYSCKKELFTGEKTDAKRQQEMLAYKNGPKAETMNLTQFKNKVNLNALGILKQQFAATSSVRSKTMAVTTEETYSGFEVLTDSIKVIRDKGHTMYIFPVALSSKRAKSFQNLTIDESASGTVAFVNTYTPTQQWVEDWKEGHPGKFEGEISVTYLSLGNGTAANSGIKSKSAGIASVSQTCITTTYYYQTPYLCASGLHSPGEECTLTGFDRAGYTYTTVEETTCTDDPDPNTGNGGGTAPTPPSGYNPCPGGPIETSTQSLKKQKGNKVMIIAPSECDSLPVDCAGVRGGTAYMADCGCIGGTTGIIACPPDIIDNLSDSCLKKSLTLAINADFTNTVDSILKKLNANTKIKVSLIDRDTVMSGTQEVDGKTTDYDYEDGIFSCTIILNKNILSNASQEYAVQVIIHEALHAYLQYDAGNAINHYLNHAQIAEKYVTPFAGLLQTIFPNLSSRDATALAWGGLQKTPLWNTSMKNDSFTYGNGESMTYMQLGGVLTAHHYGYAENAHTKCGTLIN